MEHIRAFRLIVAALALVTLSDSTALCQTYTTIYQFAGTGLDYPNGLVRDVFGNLYGTASARSGNCTNGVVSSACGVIYELSLGSNGEWSRAIIHTFGGADGINPVSLIIDSRGNLYGTTTNGAANGFGAVFMLTHTSGWTEQILYNYAGGVNQEFGVTVDSLGNVYGTDGGGHYKAGRVFELTQNTSGAWDLSYIYSFGIPEATAPSTLAVDASGNLYGADPNGEYNHNFQGGTVYKLSPGSNGVWTSSIIWDFVSTRYFKTSAPFGMTIDPFGNLYGFVTGLSWRGSSIEPYGLLAPDYTQGLSVWYFQNSRYQGIADYPASLLTFDSLGNVYGAVGNEDSELVHHPYDGYVFRNGPSGQAVYYFPTLSPPDRYYPCGALAPDGQGNLYGTTCSQSNGVNATVFEITF